MDSVGQKLKTARVAKKLTLQEAAGRTQIKVQQLEALERDDYSVMPAPVYTRGFIKLYAKTVDLDGAALVEQFNASQREEELPDIEVGAEMLDKKPVVEQDEADKDATITHTKPRSLSGGTSQAGLNQPDWMMQLTRYLPLVAALFAVLLLLWGLKSLLGSSTPEEGINPQVFESISPLIVEPPEPYLKLE